MDLAKAPTQDGKILREDVHQTVIDGTPSGNHAITQEFALVEAKVVCAVRDEGIDFSEGTFIEQHVDALARGQTTFFVLGFDASLSTAHPGLRFEVTQTLDFWIIAHELLQR
jgi:hypothetical protein